MADTFDPYLEWLGVRETARPLSHYQLIGVAEFEDNALAISVAAESAISRVRGCKPGERAGRWQQLLDELTLAKLCLTNRVRKSQYDSQLLERRGGSGNTIASNPIDTAAAAWPPSEQPVAVVSQSAPQMSAPAVQQSVNTDLFPPSYRPAPAVVVAAPVAMPAVATAQAVYPTQPQVTFTQPAQAYNAAAPPVAQAASMPQMAPPVAYAAPVAVAPVSVAPVRVAPIKIAPVSVAPTMAPSFVAPSVAVVQPMASLAPANAPMDRVSDSVFMDKLSVTVHEPLYSHATVDTAEVPATSNPSYSFPDNTPRNVPARTVWSPDPVTMGIGGLAVFVGLMFVVMRSGSKEEPGQVAQSSPSQTEIAPQDQPEPETTADVPDLKPEPVKPRPKIERPVEPKPRPPKPEPTQVAENPTPEPPKPEPKPEPAKPQQSPEQKAAFEKAIKNARAAMGARNLERARNELNAAKATVGMPEQETKVARLESLYGYVEGFWNAVRESLKGFQPTDTIPIDNTEIAIVEVDDHSITIRAAGKNMSYDISNMPVGLAMTLATRWFDPKVAANKLYLGAFHAVDPKGDLNDARRFWQEASAGGASADELLPLLDEQAAPLVTEQSPVPDKAMLAQARKALKTTMAQEFKVAKAAAQKLDLARELLGMAKQTENQVERYVLYDEALNLAAEIGNAGVMSESIDSLAAWYKVDPWVLRAKAFSEANSAATNPVVAKAIARAAVDLVNKAVADKHPTEAAKLCDVALAAAKKGKDLDLVKQATDLKAKIGGAQ